MNVRTKSVIFLLFSLYSFTIFLRYPLSSFSDNPNSQIGESMNDSLVYHSLSTFIVEKGFLSSLFMSPLGFFGMYPFSNPSASQTTVAALSLITGINISPLILVHDVFLGFISIGLVFMLSLEFKRNNFFAFFSTFVYNTHWYYLNQTIWFLTLRGHFIAFLPLVIFAFIRTFRIFQNNKKEMMATSWLLLFLSSYFILFSSHRMVAFVLPTILLPLLLIKLIYNTSLNNWLQPHKNGRNISIYSGFIAITLLFLAIYKGNWFDLIGLPVPRTENIETSLSRYPQFGILNQLISLLELYLSRNILQFFSFIAFVLVLFRKIRYKGELAFIILLIFQARFIVDIEYYMPVASLLLSLFTGLGVFFTFQHLSQYRKSIPPIIFIFLLFTSSWFTMYIKEINTSKEYELKNIDIGQGTPLESWDGTLWVSNNIDEDSGVFFEDSTSMICLLAVHPYRTLYTSSVILNDVNTRERLYFESSDPISMLFHQRDFSTYGGELYDPVFQKMEPLDMTFYHDQIIYGQPRGEILLESLDMNYVISGEWEINSLQGPFFTNLDGNNYIIYENELFTFWFYEQPI